MSRCAHSELRTSDSQDLGPLDSFSLPSEPPDIRNWYSSYVYESPVLNTLDGFQDLVRSGETSVEDGKNKKFGGDRPVGEFDHALVDAPKKPSEGMRSDESLGTGSSESLSSLSEPPDIKQWFPSYVYESPALDTALDFAISDYKESEDGKLCNVQRNCRQDKKDAVAFVGAEENIVLCSQRRDRNMFIKCTNLVKDPTMDYQSVSKDIHHVAPKSMPSTVSQLNCDKVSHSSLSERRRNNHDEDDDGNSHVISTDEKNPISLNVEKYIGSLDGESAHMSIGRIDAVKEKVEKEDFLGISDLSIPKGDSCELASQRSSHGKENDENGLSKNGFISIRKKSYQVNDERVTRRVRADEVELKRNQEKDAKIVRNILSDISNFSSGDSKGKWQCPQKNKPELGPPLKQLRLDQWFYRR